MPTPRKALGGLLASVTLTAALAPSPALALGEPGHEGETGGDSDANGNIFASATHSRIKITQVSGSAGGNSGSISSTDVNWEPPPCWYEPVFTPEQLKEFSETSGQGYVSPHVSWYGEGLWTDHYRDGKDATNWNDDELSTAKGYDNYNLGQDGYFWRGVAPDTADPESWNCDRVMFWQDAGEIPDVPNAPTPQTLAEYAYDKVKVPDTEIELKPEAKSTVNLPTWVWLDKGTFQEVEVRAELPNTNLWAETTAKPVALHLEPGTEDAETFPPPATARSTTTAPSAPRTGRATARRPHRAASGTCGPPTANRTNCPLR